MIKEKFNKFIKKNFVKDVATLQVGTIISTGLGMVASIIFARILKAENYGIYSLIFALTGLFGLFSGLGADYTTLTLLPEAYARKDKEEIKNIITYYFKITLFSVVLVNILAIIVAPLLAEVLYHQKLIGYLSRWILSASIVGIFLDFFIIILQTIRKIKNLTILENSYKLLYNLIPIVFILTGLGLLGIVWGRFLAEAIFFGLALFAYKLLTDRDKLLPSVPEIFSHLFVVKIKKYLKLGIWVTIEKKISNFVDLIPITLLGIFALTTSQVAYFKIAVSYIGLPLVALSPITRLLSVQLPKSKTYGLKIFKRDFLRASIFSGIGFLFILFFSILVAPFLVETFYGKDYLISTKLIYALIFSNLFAGFAVGYGAFLRIFNKLNIPIIINTISVVLMITFFFIFKEIVPIIRLIIIINIFINWFSFSTMTYFIFKFFKEAKEV